LCGIIYERPEREKETEREREEEAKELGIYNPEASWS